MEEQLFIPNPSLHNVVTYQILVNGQVVNPVYELLSMVITREMNRVPLVKLTFKDGDPSIRTFEISDKNDFTPGNPIVVKLGRDGTNDVVFKGIIVKHGIRVKENGQSELMVECKDEVVRMTVGRHSKYFTKIKDSDLFNTLVTGYPHLSCNVKATAQQHEELVQHHLSDWDFMLLRAEANSMLVNVLDGAVNIAVPQTSGNPVLQVAFGSSVLEFEAEMDVRNQWKNAEARSWDYHNQALFTADASSATGWKESGNIDGATLAGAINLKNYEMQHSGYLPEQELQTWVNGVMLRSRLAKICGRAKFAGFSGVKPGDLVKLTGVGNRFNGNVFVTAVRQEVGNGMWDTHIQFGLDARRYAELYADIHDRKAAGLSGGIHGLQIGLVTKLEGDPEGQDRILVRMPLIDNGQDKGIWTRVASPDAGNNRGLYYRPEINDEVIIGFINGDPSQAVMVGGVNSSAKPAPNPTSDQNDIKGFTTRSKMHILFDDGKKTISIDTPNGNKVLLDDTGGKIQITDQNNNSITLDSSGITITSQSSNVTLQAPAGSLNLTAGQSFTVSAPSISLTASTSASITAPTVSIN